jgi:hypothetical protein
MLYAIRHSKLVPTALSALIVLGMWSNAMAALSCPHMIGSSDCCLRQETKAHSQARASDSGTSMPCDMDHEQMSDMAGQDMSMDMADMQMDDATSQPDSDTGNKGTFQFTPNAQASAEAVTQPYEPCPHCMMHSRSTANFPFKAPVQNSTTYQIVAADIGGRIVNAAPSALTFVELHDHGPPGSNAPLYVLVSAFRI